VQVKADRRSLVAEAPCFNVCSIFRLETLERSSHLRAIFRGDAVNEVVARCFLVLPAEDLRATGVDREYGPGMTHERDAIVRRVEDGAHALLRDLQGLVRLNERPEHPVDGLGKIRELITAGH